jgi:molybdenum cofactor cytidylyltransferase
MAVVGILLAAGESSRMKRPKALLPWGDAGTLLEYQVEQMKEAGCEAVLVVSGATSEVGSIAEGLGAVIVDNPNWREGRASSMRAGAAAAPPETEIVVVVSADQPAPAAVIRRLLDCMKENPAVIYVPAYDGRRGHPVVLPGKYLAELREVKEETEGLRDLIDAYPPVEVEIDEPLVTADINTPDDYVRWHEQAFGTKPEPV